MLAVLFTMLLAQAQPLTLDGAVKLAMERNPDLLKQTLLSLSAEQDKVIARGAVLPRLDFNASGGRVRQAGPLFLSGVAVPGQNPNAQVVTFANVYQASLTLTQVLFDGSKWWNNLAAGYALESTRAQVDEQRLQITYLVEQRFYELVRAQRQLAVLSDAAARSRDQADFTQRLFEGGRSSQADVYAARANRDNDEVNRLGQERTVELARADLAVAIGVDPSEPLTVAEPQNLMAEPSQPPASKAAIEQALSRRPSLKAFAATAEQGRKLATAARGGYWPVVSLQGSWGRTSENLTDYTSTPADNSQLSGQVLLSWNLFNGLSTSGAAEKADLQVRVAENDLDNGRRNVASDVQKAVAQLSTARSQVRVAQQAEATAREGLRLARTRQEVGVGTQLEVRDAELKLTQAQLNVVGSLVDGREAEAALRRAVGG